MERAQRNRTQNTQSARRNVRPRTREEVERARRRAIHQRKLRKKRMRIKFFFKIIKLSVFVGIAIGCGRYLWTLQTPEAPAKEKSFVSNNVNVGATVAKREVIIDNNRILEDIEVEEKLKELASENTNIAEIYADRKQYPEELLAALANNQEMLGFVMGYLTADSIVTDGISNEEKKESFPLFLQWDKRWGYANYGTSNIGIAGCGPTCLSMVIFALTGNENATPNKLADYSMKNGHYETGYGTAWTLMTAAASTYDIKAKELGLAEDEMKQKLDRGNPIICAMRQGDFTTTGHFIVIYDYDENGFIVNDPNSIERSQKRWTFETLQYQIKNLWYYQI